MTRPPLANVSDDIVEYILCLEKEILELKTENSQLKRQTSLEKMKAVVNKKNGPPRSDCHRNSAIGIIVHK
jgi:hypothetical protein